MNSRSVLTGCFVLLLLVVVLPGMSVAAGVINGCVGPNGKLRIVTPPATCLPSETPISWNEAGPAGPAGVANGIRAAVWGQFTMDMQNPGQNCSVGFSSGADNVVGASTGNDAECRLTFTLPAGQPQTWGTAYECFTSLISGNGTSYDTTCQNTGDMDAALKPAPIFACRNGSNSVPSTFYAQVNFLCIAP